MSRLKKISNNKLISILDKWVTGYNEDINNNDIDNLINQNKDCLYSGAGYRTLHYGIVWDNFYNSLNNPPEDFDLYDDEENLQEAYNYKISKEQIFNYAYSIINETNDYCSFSKTIEAYNDTKDSFDNLYDGANSIGIKTNIHGISVNMLVEKYEKELEELNSPIFNLLHEDEIIAKMPNDYEIIEFLKIPLSKWENEISFYDLKEMMLSYE